MNYSPKQLLVWDGWTMPRPDAGRIHLYHLQRRREDVSMEEVSVVTEDSLGHAISHNLIDWEEQPPVFGPDPSNPRDDLQPWTGCALWHEGKAYLFYTMRGTANESRVQAIGLATSPDGIHWERHADNPVIVPDAHWYATDEVPVPGFLDCRDLVVIPDEEGGWLGFYATRIPGGELPETSAIACVKSQDLVHWEHLPPAFVPGNNACVEVPDVFCIDGRWFMTCLAGHYYGNRGFWTDPHMVNGTLYAVADRPEGPYRETTDNVLLAARTTAPLSCRSFDWEGERYVLYTDRERSGRDDNRGMAMGTISTPKVLRRDGDRLFLAYSDRIEEKCGRELISEEQPARHQTAFPDTQGPWGQIWPMPSASWFWNGQIQAQCRSGWEVALLDVQEMPESFIMEATITLHEGVAAGFALRVSGKMAGGIVEMSASNGTVAFHSAPAFDWSEIRQAPIPRGVPCHLRVVNRLEHIEIYLNDELKLAFSRYAGLGGGVGLFIDRGRATFENLRLRELMVSQSS